MEIQSVKNTNSDIKFKSKNAAQNGETVAFVDLNDRQLKNLAYAMTRNNENASKKQKNRISSTYIAMPIVDTIASGVLINKMSHLPKAQIEILRKLPLSIRTFSAAKTAANWGVGLALIGVYNVAKKALVSQSPSVKKFDQEHPVVSFFTDMAAITAGFLVAMKGLNKQAAKYFTKNPNKMAKFEDNMAKIATKLDNTNLNKTVLPKVVKKAAEFAEKAPFLAKAGRFALANSVWILLGASFLHTDGPSKKDHAKAEETYQKLKVIQAQTIEKMDLESDD